jgi:spermidine synthase
MLMCDFQLLCQLNNSLKNIINKDNKTKHFIKLYILEKLPLVGLIYIQKMSESNNIVDISNEKLLAYEIYEDYSITKPISYTMEQLKKSITYMYEMYNYQGYLSILHPGYIIPIKIKENFWSENIDYTLTICDSDNPDLISTKKCVAIIVSKNYANDFIYINPEGNMSLCKQVNAARILLISPAPFNYDDVNTIKKKMNSYILLFKFKDCVSDAIPIMLMGEENNETNNVFINDTLKVVDVVDNEKKDILRQLIFLESPNEIQSEIKISLTSKKNIKNDRENKYHPIYTTEKYSNKNLVECLDENYLSMFYIKSILSSILFINLENYPENKINILVLGAGIGTINFYFDKILKSNVNIDAIELNNKVTEIGKEYFGLNNYKYKKGNIKWYFEDAKKFLINNTNNDYYDMIVMDINNTNHNEGISPPPIFFEKMIITKIFSLLKPHGLYVINVMARSFKNYCDSFKILDGIFPNIFLVDNTEDLNKIHFCFKSKNEIKQYIQTYEKNIEKLKNNEIADIEIIKETHKKILTRVVDTENVKKKIEDYENKKKKEILI